MARYCQTDGICLRRLDYSNTSQVATFLTRDSGQLSFIAKGLLRAPKKGVSAGLELLGVYRLVYSERRTGSLHNLTEACLVDQFRAIRQKVERILCGYYAAELMLHFTAEDEPCAELYGLLLEALRRFEKGEGLGLSVLMLEIGALRHYGACPTFDRCAECGGGLPPAGRLLFSLTHSGPLCAACGQRLYPRRDSDAAPVKTGCLALLAALASGSGPTPGPVRPEPREIVDASWLLRLHMRYLLGRELRMWKYLQGRHLSRALRRIRRAESLRAMPPPRVT